MNKIRSHINKFVKLQKGKNVLMIRNAECMADYSGTIVGWTDSPLTINGRQQANKLFQCLYDITDQFHGIYTSDLSRSIDTYQLAFGFPEDKNKLNIDKRLRELYFGIDEGKHFDSLSDKEKEVINSIDYQAPSGESWEAVKKRMSCFYQELQPNGNYLVFTDGGLICSQTYDLGLQDVISHCGIVGLQINETTNKPEKLLFHEQMEEQQEL